MSDIHGVSDNPQQAMADLFKFMEKEMAKERKKESASRVMKRAWRRAKAAAEKFGGKASEYIRETMKSAWKTERRVFPTKPKKPTKQASAGPISESSIKLNVLYDVLRDAQTYGDSHDSNGATLESMNAGNLLEFLYDLEEEKGADWIIKQIESSGKTVYQLAETMERIVRGHYDDEYARWAGGSEAFKQALRDLEMALAGTNSNLVGKFF